MNLDEYISYRSSTTVLAEGVYHFLTGGIYGSIWGMVSPFPTPGTVAAATEATSTGMFRPVVPFSALSAIPTNAIIFGTILGVQSVSSKSIELIRMRDDYWNEIFGFGVTYRYYTYFLSHSDQRLLRHNRFVGGAVAMAILYSTIFT